MIDIPRQFSTPIISAKTPKSAVRFNSISDDDKKAAQIERRLSPTRRQPRQQGQTQIERRVSSDRRRSSFSSKA